MLMDAFRSCVLIYIIELSTRAHSTLATGLSCLCFTSEQHHLLFFLSFHLFECVIIDCSNRDVGGQAQKKHTEH